MCIGVNVCVGVCTCVCTQGRSSGVLFHPLSQLFAGPGAIASGPQ